MRALLCLGLAGCWTATQPSSPPPRATTPVAVAHATTPAAAQAPAPADDGTETVLTAKRWKYASYFNGLKRKIHSEWQPSTVWNALAQIERSAYGTAMRTTLVEIELDAHGGVAGIAVLRSSGITELDVEALRSVEAAAPFGPPPTSLPTPFKFEFRFEITPQSGGIRLAP